MHKIELFRFRFAAFGKEFTLEPNSLNVTEQETVVLHCKIHSVPTAEIHWEVDDSSLPHNTRYYIIWVLCFSATYKSVKVDINM